MVFRSARKEVSHGFIRGFPRGRGEGKTDFLRRADPFATIVRTVADLSRIGPIPHKAQPEPARRVGRGRTAATTGGWMRRSLDV